MHGFPPVGRMEDSGLFRKIDDPDASYTPVEEVFNPASNIRWRKQLEASMWSTAKAASTQGGSQAARAAYDATLAECGGSDPTTWGVEL